jgi:8-oxo-dGTP pyrophosphatase MutT (NUDIX family)
MKEEISSGIIIFRNKGKIEFLFLKRREGFLDMPKGHIEKGESELIAAKREALEETGLTVNLLEGFRELQEYWYTYEGEKIWKKVSLYLGNVSDNSEVHISQEHTGFVWLSLDESMKSLSFQNQKEIIRKAYDFIIANGQYK